MYKFVKLYTKINLAITVVFCPRLSASIGRFGTISERNEIDGKTRWLFI